MVDLADERALLEALRAEQARRVRVVRPPSCVYLKVCGAVSPQSVGFVPDARFPGGDRWWRPGWCGFLKLMGRSGVYNFEAWADKGKHVWPQPWGEHMHVTRVDVCCDIVLMSGNRKDTLQFTEHHRQFFTGRGSDRVYRRKHELRTMYINSRESPVSLRIYLKTAKCDDRDKRIWSSHGWCGEDVWRVEYEFHHKRSRPVLPDSFECPRDIGVLWADALARVRMCEVPPRTCSQQNKAPTHPWWLALGRAKRLTRRRGELHVTPASEAERNMASLKRLVDRSGVDMLDAYIRHIMRTARVQGRRVAVEETATHGEREA